MVTDDANPYASPKTPTALDWRKLQEIEGAWRSGDEMLLTGGKSKTPRACWISNRTTWIDAGSLPSMPTKLRIPLLFLLALPVVGYTLVAGCLVLNALLRRFPRVNCWLRTGTNLCYGTVETVANVLIAIGCVGANFTWLGLVHAAGPAQVFATYAVVLLVLAAGIALDAIKGRALPGLAIERKPDGLIHVRGVHPDYLARLPEYPRASRSVP